VPDQDLRKFMTTTFWQPLTIMPFAAIGAILTWVPPGPGDITVLAVIAAFAVLGNYCSIQALRIADTSVTMPIDYTKLVWSVIGAYVLFNEIPSAATAVGALLIVGSSLYIALREGRHSSV
jgi:drug/metabolite transporter (DMT)-like permease